LPLNGRSFHSSTCKPPFGHSGSGTFGDIRFSVAPSSRTSFATMASKYCHHTTVSPESTTRDTDTIPPAVVARERPGIPRDSNTLSGGIRHGHRGQINVLTKSVLKLFTVRSSNILETTNLMPRISFDNIIGKKSKLRLNTRLGGSIGGPIRETRRSFSRMRDTGCAVGINSRSKPCPALVFAYLRRRPFGTGGVTCNCSLQSHSFPHFDPR